MGAEDQVAGYIFMCNSKTKPDCFVYRVFGLPASRMAVVEKIKPNTKLFLYDFDVKLLYGLYVADSGGKLAIEPYAFGGRFPAQVKFSIARDCLPLPEVAFKEAIRENYNGSKFKQDLNEEQVNKLASLFCPITVSSLAQPSPVFHGAVESLHQGHRGSSFQNTNFCSHGQYAADSDYSNEQLHASSSFGQEVPPHSLSLAHNQVGVVRNHTLASQPLLSQSCYPQHDPALATETYCPDHLGVYQHNVHVQYDKLVPEKASASSYSAPLLGPHSHISPQQSHSPSSSMTAAQWVATASEVQTFGPQTSISSISSNELQSHYKSYYGQTQGGSALAWTPSSGGSVVDNASMYHCPMGSEVQTLGDQTLTSTIPSSNELQCPHNGYYAQSSGGDNAYMYQNGLGSEYQYQGYQTSDQMISGSIVQRVSNVVVHVSETHLSYQTTMPPGYRLPKSSASDISTGSWRGKR